MHDPTRSTARDLLADALRQATSTSYSHGLDPIRSLTDMLASRIAEAQTGTTGAIAYELRGAELRRWLAASSAARIDADAIAHRLIIGDLDGAAALLDAALDGRVTTVSAA